MPVRPFQQLSPRLRIGLAVILILLGIQYAMLPAIQWHADTINRVVSLKASIARKKALIGKEAKIDAVLEKSRDLLKQWRALYPAGPSDARSLQLSLQKRVEALAAKYGIKTDNVDWLPAASEDLVRGAVRFRMETRPEPLLNLVYALESAQDFIAIDGIRINTRGRSKTTLTAELDISAYAVPGAMAAQ